MPFDSVCTNCQAPYHLADTMRAKLVLCKQGLQAFSASPVGEPGLVEDPGAGRVQDRPPAHPTGPVGGPPRRPPSRRRDYEDDPAPKGPLVLILCLVGGGVFLLVGGALVVLLIVL